MSVRAKSVHVFLSLFALAVGGCEITPAGPPPPPPPPVVLTTNLPQFTALDESPQKQTKGGITITLTPVTYDSVIASVESIHVVGEVMHTEFGRGGYQQPIRVEDVTTSSKLTVKPDTLRFKVAISNGLNRVFRPQGAIVQFNAAGRVIESPVEGYAAFSAVIIPPRGQAEVEVYGPNLSAIDANTTIGLFLYDVPTAVDAAGNITEKQNFEWYFAYSSKAVTKEAPPTTTNRRGVPIGPKQPL